MSATTTTGVEVFEGQAFLDALADGRKDFTGCEIRNVDIRQVALDDINFINAILENMVFSCCELKSVDFINAKLNSVRYSRSTLDSVDFGCASLEKCEFCCGEMDGNIVFENATLSSVCFSSIHMNLEEDVSLSFDGSVMEKVCFRDMVMGWTSFENADLSDVKFFNIIADSCWQGEGIFGLMDIFGGDISGENTIYLNRLLHLCRAKENGACFTDKQLEEMSFSEMHLKLLTEVRVYSRSWVDSVAFLTMLRDCQMQVAIMKSMATKE